MKIYEFSNYKSFLKEYIEVRKSIGSPLTYQEIASKLRIQKSYLSKVLNGDANLNRDQAFLLAEYINLKPDELIFLNLLIDYERSGLEENRAYLSKQIKNIQNEKTQSVDYLEKQVSNLSSNEIQEYYLLAETQLIHLSLSISKYQRDPRSLINDLRINEQTLNSSIDLLERLNFIEIKNKIIKLKKSNLHLSPNSPFFYQWQTQFKQKSIEWNKSLNPEDKYNFIASFTGEAKDKENIRIEFMKFLKKVEKIVSKSKSNELYQLNFDLFKWL